MERLVYRSRIAWPAPRAVLEPVLAVSAWNNARSDLTGALGYSDAFYLQFLEGPTNALEDLLVRLQADVRHSDLTILMRAKARRRLLPDWSMASIDLSGPAPEVCRLLAEGDGLGLATLMAGLVHRDANGLFARI